MPRRPPTEAELRLLAQALAELAMQIDRVRQLTRRAPTSPIGLYGSTFRLRGCVVDIQVPKDVTLEDILKATAADMAAEGYATTALHEFAHWYQYACTPYGMYLVQAQERQTAVVRVLCESIVTGLAGTYGAIKLPRRTLPMPFFQWLIDNLDTSTGWGVASLNAIRRWLAAEDIIAALEGLDPMLDNASLATAFILLEQLGNESGEVLEFPSTRHRSNELILNDTIQPTVEGEPFGAHRIAECAAQLQACTNYDTFDEDTLVGDYRPAYQLVRDRFPDAPTGHVVRTVLALTEIAFWSDIFPYLRRRSWRRRTTMDWQDIHPGWRYVRAVAALTETGLLRRYEDYPDFVRRITDAHGWTPVQTLVRRALTRIRVPDRNPLLETFGLSCAIRRRAPAAFALWVESITKGVAGAYHPAVMPRLWRWNHEWQTGPHGNLLLALHDMHLVTRQFMLGQRFEPRHMLTRGDGMAAFAKLVELTLHLPPDRFTPSVAAPPGSVRSATPAGPRRRPGRSAPR